MRGHLTEYGQERSAEIGGGIRLRRTKVPCSLTIAVALVAVIIAIPLVPIPGVVVAHLAVARLPVTLVVLL